MRRIADITLLLLMTLLLPLTSGCDVHEWPDAPEKVGVRLCLRFNTAMTRWEHVCDGTRIEETGPGDTYDNHLGYGTIRYIVRAFPVGSKQRAATESYTHEYTFSRNISDGYDCDALIELLPGSYEIQVWADLSQHSGAAAYYNADNFAEICLQGEYRGNTDWRDAFRGTAGISVESDIIDSAPEVLEIEMERPLAKFELITTDVREFISKEIEFIRKEAASRGEEPDIAVDTDDYTVRLIFNEYLPDTYNMNTDRPIDSKVGITFESKITPLSESEASMGFDYVFVNHRQSGVAVQVGLYDSQERQVALTPKMQIPLLRNRHTVLRGSFMMQQATGGLTIDSEFDGDINRFYKRRRQ